ncbi:MAG: FAD-dependent oxidoreductase [Clostridiales bacterium]|nr:FAD-dependent oxidoreductase [Clostridiales bacterium]
MQDQPFWQTETQALFPVLRGRRNADAVIIGGGLSGLHIAYWLCKAGLRVILLEAVTIGSGASGRCTGIVTQTHGTLFSQMEKFFPPEVAQAYTQTQQSALQSLRDLASQQDMNSSWQDMDIFLIAKSEKEAALLAAENEAMARAGFTAEFTKSTQSPLPALAALHFHGQATFQPYSYLLALAESATRMGLQIYENSRVMSLETNMVYTQRGSVLAPYMVIATGYPLINTPGWYFLRMYQKTSFILPIEDGEAYDGLYLDINDRFALRRHRDGTLFHMIDSRVGTHVHGHPIQTFAERYGESFENHIPNTVYTGIDTYTADGLPYIGAYSQKTPNIFVATGYAHHGILHSVVAAQAISAKILGLPNDGYSIYSGQRRGKGLWVADAKIAAAFAGRYLHGIFRLHAPRCSHMGCKLVYRPGTKSWECPCHGSRYDDIGRVLNGPTVYDTPIHRNRRG